MEKYVRVSWPESQEWMDEKYYDEGVEFSQSCGTTVFVPEELYNEVNGQMKNYIIVAKCDPYNAKHHWHGERVLKYDGPTPVEWVAGEYDTEEEAKDELYDWCKEESMDMIEWDDEFVAEIVSEYVHEGLFGAAKEMLDEYIENGEGLYYHGAKKLDKGGWCYSFDSMSYSIESGDYGEQ